MIDASLVSVGPQISLSRVRESSGGLAVSLIFNLFYKENV